MSAFSKMFSRCLYAIDIYAIEIKRSLDILEMYLCHYLGLAYYVLWTVFFWLSFGKHCGC